MKTQEAYAHWAGQYDTNKNRTRDLEGIVLQEMLPEKRFRNILEIGCGTGKNSIVLATKTDYLLGVDITEEMLAVAKAKVPQPHAHFLQWDILKEWNFVSEPFELVTFSLVLEHIQNLDDIFSKVARATSSGSIVYVGELHPFKQYAGTKARFETANGVQEVTCFTHHVSDFISAAMHAGFQMTDLREYFDEHDRTGIPRILGLLFQKA